MDEEVEKREIRRRIIANLLKEVRKTKLNCESYHSSFYL